MTAKELERLKSGFRSFRKQYFEEQPELYNHLVTQGQSPAAMVIACADSRVHPAQVLNTEPGDIFVVRNVANMVPPCEDDGKSHGTSAAIEFAVMHLGVQHIIIMGHRYCGGIMSLMEGKHESNKYRFIDPWMHTLVPAREKVLTDIPDAEFGEQCYACEKEAIGISIENLKTFPWIRDRVEAGKLGLHGWYFDIERGELLEMDTGNRSFRVVAP